LINSSNEEYDYSDNEVLEENIEEKSEEDNLQTKAELNKEEF
jgi:hypothetical protein